jgi:hypothetical protein
MDEAKQEYSFLSRDAILGNADTVMEVVEIPEWGGKINVKSLSAKERDQFEASMFTQKGDDVVRNLENLRARLVSKTACDEKGNLLFREDDVRAIGKKNAAAVDRAFAVAQRLSRLRKEDIKAMTKNSEEGQKKDSISD